MLGPMHLGSRTKYTGLQEFYQFSLTEQHDRFDVT
jgi:hypothetical protein